MSVKTFHHINCDGCGRETKTSGQGVRPEGWGGPMRFYRTDGGDDYCPECTQKMIAVDWADDMPMPQIGQDVYIPSAGYIDHGEDDIQGGLAKINKIEYNPGCSCATNRVSVRVAEVPGHLYNYIVLMREADKRRKEYGEGRAYPDPDVNEFGIPNRY